MVSNRVKTLAEKVRNEVQVWIYNNYDIDYETLCGACGIASYALYRVLKRNGFKPKFVVGGIDGHQFHCWVELNGYCIDLTATQFGKQEKIYIKKKSLYNIAKDYNQQMYGNRGIKFLNEEWGQQSPVIYHNEIKTLIKQLTPKRKQGTITV